MTPPTNQIDEKLDEWGSRLFNVSAATPSRHQATHKCLRLGAGKSSSTGGRLSTSQTRANYVRQKLQAMVRHAPQVVVKLAKARRRIRYSG